MDINLLEIWNVYEEMKSPSAEEMCEVIQRQPDLLVGQADLTPEYIQLQRIYKFLFGLFFVMKSGICKVEEELEKRGCVEVSVEEMDFFQKYDGLSLRYIYLRSWAHIERLSENEKEILEMYKHEPQNKEFFVNALALVEKTCHKVLTVNPERKEEWFEIFPSIHGEGRMQGKNIVFGIKIENIDFSQNILVENVARQLEPILKDMLHTEVKFVRM